jgi:sortase A
MKWRDHSWSRPLTRTFAWVFIAAALFIAGSIGLFYYHSSTTGGQLVRHEAAKIAAAGHAAHESTLSGATPTCAPLSDQDTTSPQGLVVASAIGLKAPVLGGDGTSQLNVAVGHVPGSVWPGQPGTALFAAHDVSYFSGLTGLHVGQQVEFATPCDTYSYQVTGHQIVSAGSPVYSSPQQHLLVMETCYPLNALYITSKRYLVTAELTGVQPTGQPAGLPTVATLTVPVPAALQSQGLTLATNTIFLGTLALRGTPSSSWTQSPAPIDDEASVLADYFAAVRSAEQNQSSWWNDVAPGIPFSATRPLRGGHITTYAGSVNPILTVQGHTVVSAALSLVMRIAGGSAPGSYLVQVTMAVQHGGLVINQWKMTSTS